MSRYEETTCFSHRCTIDSMTRDADITRYRKVPDIVVLPGHEAPGTATRPPVRIFLGTEDGQWRAERIFFYSIEQVRDPTRTYQIHVMKNLDGFDRDGWRTGFTNYRFAVPELAGVEGRAIYNDVDQIYLADPAGLFDLDMGSHGYLSVSAEDTSVMLMDCARMGRWWTYAKAATGGKLELLRGPSSEPGVWGRLDDCWNARDVEFVDGESKVLHFTALHTQPWQPFPEDYSYHAHPLSEVWLGLERQADAQGYQMFGPDRPSPQLTTVLQRRSAPAPPLSTSVREFLATLQARKVLAVTIGKVKPSAPRPEGELEVEACPVDRLAADTERFDAVVAMETLGQCPAEDMPWLLEAIDRKSVV